MEVNSNIKLAMDHKFYRPITNFTGKFQYFLKKRVIISYYYICLK